MSPFAVWLPVVACVIVHCCCCCHTLSWSSLLHHAPAMVGVLPCGVVVVVIVAWFRHGVVSWWWCCVIIVSNVHWDKGGMRDLPSCRISRNINNNNEQWHHHCLLCGSHITAGNVAPWISHVVVYANVSGTRLVGDMVLPCHSCCLGCGQQMWCKAAISSSDDDMTVVRRWQWWVLSMEVVVVEEEINDGLTKPKLSVSFCRCLIWASRILFLSFQVPFHPCESWNNSVLHSTRMVLSIWKALGQNWCDSDDSTLVII